MFQSGYNVAVKSHLMLIFGVNGNSGPLKCTLHFSLIAGAAEK